MCQAVDRKLFNRIQSGAHHLLYALFPLPTATAASQINKMRTRSYYSVLGTLWTSISPLECCTRPNTRVTNFHYTISKLVDNIIAKIQTILTLVLTLWLTVLILLMHYIRLCGLSYSVLIRPCTTSSVYTRDIFIYRSVLIAWIQNDYVMSAELLCKCYVWCKYACVQITHFVSSLY